MKCKYCEIKIPGNFVDEICDACWELKHRVESIYNNDVKEKILNELGWYKKGEIMAKIKIDEKYVRCRFCDSSWFIYTLKDSNNVYKETPKMLQYNCPTCGHVQTSKKFNTDKEDLPDNMKEIK